MAKTELQSIQVLRAAAASMVILGHVSIFPPSLGGSGVDIFFVISGFIIGFVVDNGERAFLPKRVFRVVPLYWLGTFAVFGVAKVSPSLLQHTTASTADLIKSLLFVPYLKWGTTVEPVLFQGWTLNYEMFFYLIMAAALALSRRWALVMTGIIMLLIVTWGLTVRPAAIPLRFWSDPIILEFAAGLLLYMAWQRWSNIFRCLPVWAAMGICICAIAFMLWTVPTVRVLEWGIPAVITVAAVLTLEGKLHWPKWLIDIGDASYSLYLLHPFIAIPAYLVLTRISHSHVLAIVMAPVVFLLCFVLAQASYRIVERPANIWLRKRFLQIGATPAPMASATFK